VPIEQPFEVNYSTASVRGWPRLIVEVWEVDPEGRNHIAGYGISIIPMEAGTYNLDICCWRPAVSFFDKIVGVYPELQHRGVLVSGESKYGFKTDSAGKVNVEISVD
jgi:B9 domain-containing protein 2